MDGAADGDSTASARLFLICWAFATLYHQIEYRDFFGTPLDVLVTTVAAVLLIRPSAALLVTLSLGQLLLVGQHLPRVYNHWYVVALANVGLVMAGVVTLAAARRHQEHWGLAPLVRAFAPAAQVFLVLLYFLTGWHKVNADFLDPAVSCASVLLDQMALRLGGLILPGTFDHGAIAFTLLVELGVPIALLVARTRRVGVVAALLFHAAMSLAGYPRFSAVGVALLLCFLTPSTHARVLAVPPLSHPQVRLFIVLGLLASAVVEPVAEVTFLVAQLSLTAWIGWAVLRQGAGAVSREPLGARSGSWLPFAAPLLLLGSGLAPYLGLQTDRAVSMYSNLRTEGGFTNHLVMSGSWQPFSYQRDLVTVLAAEGGLRPLAASGLALPFEELRARATESVARATGPLSLTYRRGGVVYRVSDLRGDSVLALPVSRLQRKLFRFRPVEPLGPRRCSV